MLPHPRVYHLKTVSELLSPLLLYLVYGWVLISSKCLLLVLRAFQYNLGCAYCTFRIVLIRVLQFILFLFLQFNNNKNYA